MNGQPLASTAAVKQGIARNFDQVAAQYDGTEEIFGYTGIATVTGDLPMRYHSPAAWWESAWSGARRISWQHIIPNRSRPAARTEVLNLLDALRAPDGTIMRTPRYGWTTACRPLEPGPVSGPGQDQA